MSANPAARILSGLRNFGSAMQKGDVTARLAAGMNFVSKHNTALGAGIGAVTGYIGSGGDLGGAVIGGLSGGIGASRRGWGRYETGKGSLVGRKAVGKLGKAYSRGPLSGIAEALGPGGRDVTYHGARNRNVTMTEFTKMPGYSRNVGGKMMATAALAPWQMAGAGVLGGMAYGLGRKAIGGIGSSFGAEKKSHYGTTFNGLAPGGNTMNNYGGLGGRGM